VLLGDPRRSYLPLAELTLLASYDVPTTREIEDSTIKPASVYELHGTTELPSAS
jgi:predicted nicotinamide N-methyase